MYNLGELDIYLTSFFQNVYSNHGLQRISYATCDPASHLLAFLAREAHAPLHLQHCHVFRTSCPEQAEDLNMLIGNAFRSAYAHQLHDGGLNSLGGHNQGADQITRPGSALGFHQRPHLSQSRSADSLLSPDVINEDQGK